MAIITGTAGNDTLFDESPAFNQIYGEAGDDVLATAFDDAAADLLAVATQQGPDTLLGLGAAGIVTLAGFTVADLARIDLFFA